MRKSGHATNAGSDPYAIQEPRQAPYTNPYDISQGYSPNDYVYKSVAPKLNADPYAKTWTDEQKKKKQLQDAMTNRDNLENAFVGMPTTEDVLQLGEYDDTIKRLSQQLGVGDSVANAPLGQGFVDDVVDREQEIADQSAKPSVPTTTEPADDEQPEFELYGSAKPEPTLAELLQQNALDKPFGQLGALTPDWEKPQDGSGNAGGGYVNLYDDIPTMEDIEAAKAEQAANGSNGVGADASDEYYIKPSNFTDEDYGKELLKQLYLHNQDGSMDAFLTQNGYAAGAEGLAALNKDIEDALGALGIDDKHEISAPTTLRPGWEGPRGEKFYLQGLSRSQDVFGDSNSEDTIEYLKIINENTPIAGGISETIDWFDYGELRMKTYTVEITTEDINKERVAQTESTIKGIGGAAGFIMDLASAIASGMQNTDSAGVTNDSFMDYGIENITGQVDTESICHAIAEFLTPKISGNETYTREVTTVYCFTPDGYGEYYYKEMVFTFDYTPDAWHYAKINLQEYYNNY